jgi:hypothetical protein
VSPQRTLSGQRRVAETEVPLFQEILTPKDAAAVASAIASGLDTFSTIIMKVINKTYEFSLPPILIPPEIAFATEYVYPAISFAPAGSGPTVIPEIRTGFSYIKSGSIERSYVTG